MGQRDRIEMFAAGAEQVSMEPLLLDRLLPDLFWHCMANLGLVFPGNVGRRIFICFWFVERILGIGLFAPDGQIVARRSACLHSVFYGWVSWLFHSEYCQIQRIAGFVLCSLFCDCASTFGNQCISWCFRKNGRETIDGFIFCGRDHPLLQG